MSTTFGCTATFTQLVARLVDQASNASATRLAAQRTLSVDSW